MLNMQYKMFPVTEKKDWYTMMSSSIQEARRYCGVCIHLNMGITVLDGCMGSVPFFFY